MAGDVVSPGAEGVEYQPRLVLDALRHRALLILIAAVVGLLVGYAGSVLRPGLYTATASVLINPLQGNPYSPDVSGQDSLVSLQTEAQVASSDSVSALVSRHLPGAVSASDLQRRVMVAVPPNTQIIEVSFESNDASFAQAAAQAYVESFLSYRAGRAQAVTTSQVTSLQAQQQDVRSQLSEARRNAAQARSGPGGSKEFYLALTQSLNSQLVSLQSQLNALSSRSPQPGHVISPAALPTQRSGIGRPFYLAAGLVLGIVMGFMVALSRQRKDERIYHVDEIESAGVAVLARLEGGRRGRSLRPEAIRRLRLHVLAMATGRPTVVVIGPSRAGCDDGGVARSLAESLANVRRSVVFGDLVGEAPMVDRETYPGNCLGLTDLLMDAIPDGKSLLRELGPGLMLLPRGRADLREVSEFLDGERMRQLIAEVGAGADYVVLRSPALSESVGETLMGIADATVATATLGRSTYGDLAVIRRQHGHHKSLLGCVITPKVVRRRFAGTRRRTSGPVRTSTPQPHEEPARVDEDAPA